MVAAVSGGQEPAAVEPRAAPWVGVRSEEHVVPGIGVPYCSIWRTGRPMCRSLDRHGQSVHEQSSKESDMRARIRGLAIAAMTGLGVLLTSGVAEAGRKFL